MRINCPPLHTKSLLLLGAAVAFSCMVTYAEEYTVYIAKEKHRAEAEQTVKAALPDKAKLNIEVLPTKCENSDDARLQARAILAGVSELPCLVVEDEDGPYALLRLNGLNKEVVKATQENKVAKDRKKLTEQRAFNSKLYLLCAGLSMPDTDDAALAKIVDECRALIEQPNTTLEQKQFIGYRCLYPALLLQYTRGYKGAHTPYTEAKLLEAIAALEDARDLDRETKIGKQAFNERERLRRARREARKYE